MVGEIMLTFELVDYRVHTSQTTSGGPPAACELHVNHKKSWSFNLQLNLKIANFESIYTGLINKLIIDD